MKNHPSTGGFSVACLICCTHIIGLFNFSMDENILDAESGELARLPHAESLLDRLARLALFVAFFGLPLIAIPSASIPFGFSKTAFFMLATAFAAALFAVARLRDGEFSFPHAPLFYGLLAVAAVSAISTLASGSLPLSWSGAFYDAGSLAFLLSLAAFLFLFAALIKNADQVFYAYLLFFVSAALVALFHIIRFAVGPEVLSFGFFASPTDTPLGRWNDLGAFFGAVAVFALATLEFMKLRPMLRGLLLAALAVSLIILAAVNFTLVWLLLGIVALVFLVYLIAFRHTTRAGFEDLRKDASAHPSAEQKETEGAATSPKQPLKIPIPSLAVFVCSAVFVVGAGTIGGAISERLNLASFEARPSFGATLAVARDTWKASPFFGAGPNMFVREWLLSKPDGTNQTIFWNTDFASGVGYLPTILVTTGLLGAVAWLFFLAAYAYAGFRFILSSASEKAARYLVGASFMTSLFLWCLLFFYASGAAILTLAFALTGLTIAALAGVGASRRTAFSFTGNPAISFAVVLGLIVFLLGDAAFAYGIGNRFASSVSYLRGIRAANERGDMQEAERQIALALARSETDVYARALTETALARLQAVLSETTEANAATKREEFQQVLGQAVEYGRDAIALDNGSYENWLALGRVYEAVVPLKIDGAYESARAAYEAALARNPKSPGILLALARLEVVKGDGERAREFIGKALQTKPNYTEAIFLLSQLEVQEGNIAGAIQSVEAAVLLSPNDPTLRFQLGLLHYNEKDYRSAAAAFERAVAQNPNYANARYFLGLAYERTSRDAEAIAQFEILAKANPDNKEIGLILKNLKAGRSPFTNAAPPVAEKPEKRSTLPVDEEER